MNSEQIVLVGAFEMFFGNADESKLQSMSEIWDTRGSYDVEERSVTFTMSRLIPKKIEEIPAVIKLMDSTARLHAEQTGCLYKHVQAYAYLESEYRIELDCGRKCEPIIFVSTRPASQ